MQEPLYFTIDPVIILYSRIETIHTGELYKFSSQGPSHITIINASTLTLDGFTPKNYCSQIQENNGNKQPSFCIISKEKCNMYQDQEFSEHKLDSLLNWQFEITNKEGMFLEVGNCYRQGLSTNIEEQMELFIKEFMKQEFQKKKEKVSK